MALALSLATACGDGADGRADGDPRPARLRDQGAEDMTRVDGSSGVDARRPTSDTSVVVDAAPLVLDAAPLVLDAAPPPRDALPIRPDAAPSLPDAALPPRDAAPPAADAPMCFLFETPCDGLCVDVSNAVQHCGECGNDCTADGPMNVVGMQCRAGSCATTGCVGARGRPALRPDGSWDAWLDCDGNPRNGCETQRDLIRCGCDRLCEDGDTCQWDQSDDRWICD